MRKIKEVLRLKFDVGLGLRQIARSCSIGLGTAHEYLQGPKLPRSCGRSDPSGMMIGLRPHYSADHRAVADQYSPARMETAAEPALLAGACRYQSVKSILKNALDAIPPAAPSPSPPPPLHDNTRGVEYFE